MLVVTCPCALSLATPAVLAAATADLARRGVLVAHSDAFETLAKATHVLWDKTGTLTRGLVRVEDVRVLRDRNEAECLGLATALERMSEHPIAKAFVASGVTQRHGDRRHGHPGSRCRGHGRRQAAAHRHAANLRPAWSWAVAPHSPVEAADGSVFLGDELGLLAGFRLTDPLRAEAPACVQQLAGLGLSSAIVSGDAAAVSRTSPSAAASRVSNRG